MTASLQSIGLAGENAAVNECGLERRRQRILGLGVVITQQTVLKRT